MLWLVVLICMMNDLQVIVYFIYVDSLTAFSDLLPIVHQSDLLCFHLTELPSHIQDCLHSNEISDPGKDRGCSV